MANFMHMKTSTSTEPLLNLDKITANKLTRIIILSNNNLIFKNSSYIALKKTEEKQSIDHQSIITLIRCIIWKMHHLKKQRKNRASIISQAHLPNDASYQGDYNESFVFSGETSTKNYRAPLRFISSLIPCLPFLAIQGFSFRNHAVVILVSIASTAAVMKLLQNPRFWKRVIILFKGTQKCVKEKPKESKKTSVAPNPKLWRLTSEDFLVTLDAYKMEYFVYNICMMLVWWLISRLVSLVRRFYSKNGRK